MSSSSEMLGKVGLWLMEICTHLIPFSPAYYFSFNKHFNAYKFKYIYVYIVNVKVCMFVYRYAHLNVYNNKSRYLHKARLLTHNTHSSVYVFVYETLKLCFNVFVYIHTCFYIMMYLCEHSLIE